LRHAALPAFTSLRDMSLHRSGFGAVAFGDALLI
jgi:hypothetical protein